MIDLKASIITIGNELLYGKTLDTNSHKISKALTDIGVKINLRLTIADNSEEIIESINLCKSKSSIIIITGGLGPTEDDITRTAIAKAFNKDLVYHSDIEEKIKVFFAERKRDYPECNKIQAMVPVDFIAVDNTCGTAPMLTYSKDVLLFSIPGVPYEAETFLEKSIIPAIKETYPMLIPFFHLEIRTSGIGESQLVEKLGIFTTPKEISLAYLPEISGVKIRLSGKESNKKNIEHFAESLKNKIGHHFSAYNDKMPENIIMELCLQKNLKLALAESCTGGLLSSKFVALPGSSAFLYGAAITYSNEAKINFLGVKQETIEKFGAVSEECAKEMSEGLLRSSAADISCAVTGIAGPDGGTKEKPVGLVYCSVSTKNGTVCKYKHHFGTRNQIRERAAYSAIQEIKKAISTF